MTDREMDMLAKAFRLRGIALQLERGELDRDFAECEVPIEERRKLIVERIRQLADDLEGR